MKLFISKGLFALTFIVFFTSCSKDEVFEEENNIEIDLSIVLKNDVEMSREILDLINNYRHSVGLNSLILDQQYASAYAVDHTDYMIEKNKISHDNFHLRSQGLKSKGAERVGENVAFGYNDAQSVVNGWLNSSSHLEIIEGNYTHSGFGIFKNEKGHFYFTQIFYLK